MIDNKVKRYNIMLIGFLCVAIICFLLGFLIAASAPDNVFAGIALMIISTILAFMAIVPAVRLNQLQNVQKENRIKRLEEDIELLKRKSEDKQ